MYVHCSTVNLSMHCSTLLYEYIIPTYYSFTQLLVKVGNFLRGKILVNRVNRLM